MKKKYVSNIMSEQLQGSTKAGWIHQSIDDRRVITLKTDSTILARISGEGELLSIVPQIPTQSNRFMLSTLLLGTRKHSQPTFAQTWFKLAISRTESRNYI